jgi:hypothetical protein
MYREREPAEWVSLPLHQRQPRAARSRLALDSRAGDGSRLGPDSARGCTSRESAEAEATKSAKHEEVLYAHESRCFD